MDTTKLVLDLDEIGNMDGGGGVVCYLNRKDSTTLVNVWKMHF